jgi:lipoprotein signal peptidase
MIPTPDKNSDYWFPAKRQGWGWGLPSNWKGWVVLVVFYALIALGAVIFLLRQQNAGFVIYCAVLCLLLLLVCHLTGEPPQWRWGSK